MIIVKQKEAYSIIEVIAVLAVIALSALIIIPKFNTQGIQRKYERELNQLFENMQYVREYAINNQQDIILCRQASNYHMIEVEDFKTKYNQSCSGNKISKLGSLKSFALDDEFIVGVYGSSYSLLFLRNGELSHFSKGGEVHSDKEIYTFGVFPANFGILSKIQEKRIMAEGPQLYIEDFSYKDLQQ